MPRAEAGPTPKRRQPPAFLAGCCFNCLLSHHRKWECREPSVCFPCLKSGHRSFECRRSELQTRRKENRRWVQDLTPCPSRLGTSPSANNRAGPIVLVRQIRKPSSSSGGHTARVAGGVGAAMEGGAVSKRRRIEGLTPSALAALHHQHPPRRCVVTRLQSSATSIAIKWKQPMSTLPFWSKFGYEAFGVT